MPSLFTITACRARTIALEAGILETDKTCLVSHEEIFGEKHLDLLIRRFARPFHPETDDFGQAVGLGDLDALPKIRLSFNIQSSSGTVFHADIALSTQVLGHLRIRGK